MRKISFSLLAILILLLSSCKKNIINNGGNWTFKGASFNVMGCDALAGGPVCFCNASVSAATSTTSNNTLYINFSSFHLPTTNVVDTVISYGTPVGNQVGLYIRLGSNLNTGQGGTYYSASGGNGSNQRVSVTVSPTGKISVSGSNIVLINDTLSTDSAILNFNISQTN